MTIPRSPFPESDGQEEIRVPASEWGDERFSVKREDLLREGPPLEEERKRRELRAFQQRERIRRITSYETAKAYEESQDRIEAFCKRAEEAVNKISERLYGYYEVIEEDTDSIDVEFKEVRDSLGSGPHAVAQLCGPRRTEEVPPEVPPSGEEEREEADSG